jgi:hypothetical protein
LVIENCFDDYKKSNEIDRIALEFNLNIALDSTALLVVIRKGVYLN